MARQALVLLGLFWFAGTAPAASWAESMFEELGHDFAAVPRGPVVRYAFRVTNKTNGPVHIASVRGSCACLTGSAAKTELAKGETGTIVAQVATDRLIGPWKKTLYVQFDRPQLAEVALTVQADVREDLTLSPETLAFGKVTKGSSPEASVTVLIAGNGSPRITGAKCDSGYVQVHVRQLRRDAREVSYQVTARLRPDLPVGHWFTTVWVTTDSPSIPRLQIPLTVRVVSSPSK